MSSVLTSLPGSHVQGECLGKRLLQTSDCEPARAWSGVVAAGGRGGCLRHTSKEESVELPHRITVGDPGEKRSQCCLSGSYLNYWKKEVMGKGSQLRG